MVQRTNAACGGRESAGVMKGEVDSSILSGSTIVLQGPSTPGRPFRFVPFAEAAVLSLPFFKPQLSPTPVCSISIRLASGQSIEHELRPEIGLPIEGTDTRRYVITHRSGPLPTAHSAGVQRKACSKSIVQCFGTLPASIALANAAQVPIERAHSHRKSAKSLYVDGEKRVADPFPGLTTAALRATISINSN